MIMKKMMGTSILAVAVGMAGIALATDDPIEMSYAFEDAAFQAAIQMNGSEKVSGSVKNIAFVGLWSKHGTNALSASSDAAITFETALAATPGNLHFVVHAGHEADWISIDEIFNQALDFDSWNPKSCPKLKELRLCDAILIAHLIGKGMIDPDAHTLSVRLALRLIQVATAEEIWSGIVDGTYSYPGPDNEKISLNWRKALEACAADAVKKLPASLDGYGLLMLPIEGRGGKALGQVFLNALTAAGRQDKIYVYDLPDESASDRMLARFLRERAGSGVALGESVMKRIEKMPVGVGIKSGKLALMSGMVSVANDSSAAQLDANGLPADFLSGIVTADAEQRKRYEITADLKFRDVNEHFRLIASIGANGVFALPDDPPQRKPSFVEFCKGILCTSAAALVIVGAICIFVLFIFAVKIFKTITRAR